MRITPRRLVVSMAFVLTSLGLLLFFKRWKRSECVHHQEPGDSARLAFLTKKLHKVLQSLGARHFLCYESLWGALYNEGPRSWDKTVEFCFVGDELSSTQQDEGFVAKAFKSQDLILHYDVLEGSYTVQLTEGPIQGVPDGPGPGKTDVGGRIIPFRPGSIYPSRLMRKTGLKRAILPEDCEGQQLLECFPAQLVSPPLNRVKFGTETLPAPREGIELQKYHYPEDWWLQRKIPPDC